MHFTEVTMEIHQEEIIASTEQEPCNFEGSDACDVCKTPCLNNTQPTDDGLTGD